MPMLWQDFVIEHGARARLDHLAFVCGVAPFRITYIRNQGACKPVGAGGAKGFVELFTLWHGRAPDEADWPPPRRFSKRSEYEWQAPEIALLASLVGRLGIVEIRSTLTRRLQAITGDAHAVRGQKSVQLQINRIGLQAGDVVSGITISRAGKWIGSVTTVQNAVRLGQLSTYRVGRLHVIPHAQWQQWLAQRATVPQGYVALARLKKPLCIASDKLSEYARAGRVPGAVQVNTCGFGDARSKFGSWYLPFATAKQLIRDRRQGRPMPWHGMPDLGNLKVTWKLFETRRHPAECATCQQIWGEAGAPLAFDDYVLRYPPLKHGAKRHLTRPWTPGITIEELAAETGIGPMVIHGAINAGVLPAQGYRSTRYITRSDATVWKSRGCPTGAHQSSWASIEVAARTFDFSETELKAWMDEGKIVHKLGTDGAARGVVYVSRWQLRTLRAERGYTEQQAAAKLRIGLPLLRELLESVNWRGREKIPLVTIDAIGKRIESLQGFTIDEAAKDLGQTEDWVRKQIHDGLVKVARAPWDRRRQYLSQPMMARLRRELASPTPRARTWGEEWLRLSQAAALAGVTPCTMGVWGEEGQVVREQSDQGWRYRQDSIKAKARAYWQTVRFKRAERPGWLTAEQQL